MHKLQKQILNVKYYDEAGVDQFYNRALNILYQDLSPEMERILDKYNISDQLIKINSLTINLGITYDTELRKQWLNKFKVEFEKELIQKITQIKNGLGSRDESINALFENEVEILFFYLKTGSLHWNSTTSDINIYTLFNRLLASNPAEIDKRIRAEAGNDKLIQRLVIQFSDKQIESLIKVLQPSESSFIIQSAAEIRKTQQRDQIVKSGNKEFRNAIWQFILSYIINNRSSYFSTREYMRSLLRSMASHYNISFHLLIQEIYKSIHQLKLEPFHFKFGNLLQDIYQSDQQGKSNDIESVIQNKQINEFLITGRVERQQSKNQSSYYTKLLQDWMSNSPLHLRQFLFSQGNAVVLKRITELIPDEGLIQLIRIISPVESVFIILFNKEIIEQQKKHNWIKTGGEQFRVDLWVILYDITLNDRSSLFSQKIFVLVALEKLSNHYNLNASFFIEQIMTLVNNKEKSFASSSLFSLFVEIRKDFFGNKMKKSISEKIKINSYLEYLTIAISESTAQTQKKTSEYLFSIYLGKNEIINYLLKKNPKALSDWMFKNLSSKIRASKFINEISIDELGKLIDLLSIMSVKRIDEFSSILLKLNKSNSLKKLELSKIEIYQFAFIFLVTSKLRDNLEGRLLAFMIKKIAEKVQIEEAEIIQALIQETENEHNLLIKETRKFLAREFEIEKKAQRKLVRQQVIEEKEINDAQKLVAKSQETLKIIENDEIRREIERRTQKVEIAENILVKEVSKINVAKELDYWLTAKLNIIQQTDLGRLKQVFKVYFNRQTEKKWQLDKISESIIKEILYRISLVEKPFLSNYITDLDLIHKEVNSSLEAVDINWSRLQILRFWVSEKEFSQKELTDFLLKEMSLKSPKSINELKSQLFEIAKKMQRNLKSTLILDLGTDISEKNKMPEENTDLKIKELLKPEKEKRPMDEPEIDESETIYIANAGLVLLNPFIPVLFERAGFVADREFIDEEKQKRAVQLLQYCVGSSENIAEYLLVLPKILCGVEINEPIESEFLITDDEKELVNSLLKNVISQWRILGETTIEGLQQTFIERNGALRIKNERWEMQVEQRSFDMLLDQIPWTYSLIKYPWMQKPLSTLWR